jgi:hypothetical protein
MFLGLRLAAAADVLLVILAGLFPNLQLSLLPLGGSDLAQLGVLLGIMLFAFESIEAGKYMFVRACVLKNRLWSKKNEPE